MVTPEVIGPAPPPLQSGGARIPRLQELSFLTVAMRGVAEGAGFEQIRRSLIDHMVRMRLNSDATGNTAPFRIAKDDPGRYVSNVSEALKELMHLGLVDKATVPSSARAARNYAATTFAPTSEGVAWAQLLQDDLRSAYDHLLHLLWNTHPQFAAFLKEINGQGLVIPLLPWGRVSEPVTRDRYLRLLPRWVSERLGAEPSGWTASESEIEESVGKYLADRYEDARGRGRDEPYPKNRDFVGACEEALVKFAFTQRGVAIDYISHQIVRRWTKELGVANYSYHVPPVERAPLVVHGLNRRIRGPLCGRTTHRTSDYRERDRPAGGFIRRGETPGPSPVPLGPDLSSTGQCVLGPENAGRCLRPGFASSANWGPPENPSIWYQR